MLDVFEKLLSIVSTPVHLDFLTLTPFLLPLPAFDKASLFPSLLPVILHNGTRCGRLQRTFISVILRRRDRATLLIMTATDFVSVDARTASAEARKEWEMLAHSPPMSSRDD